MKKKDSTGGASEWASAPAGRITPLEVQQKEFQVARFGAGYRMREVDEFLDQVTDALTALVAENERLLRASGDRDPASGGTSVRPTTGDADRAAVEAFLRREKGFLQDLGGLVQEHAEELRSMVRAVRQDASTAAAQASPRGSVAERAPEAAEQAPERAPEAPEQAPEVAAPEVAAAPEASPAPASDESDAPPETAQDSDAIGTTEQATASSDVPTDDGEDDDRKTIEGSATVIADAVADEPIRIDDPEPARSGRRDEEEDRSLRELFWGEE
jgi:DivIVA domain-containing protein